MTVNSNVKDVISKFYSDSYPDMVKNPVLILNYLFQHSFINRPEYTITFERQNPPYFIVACFVNTDKTIGTGSSKKAARTVAAQKMLIKLENINSEDSEDNSIKCVESSDWNSLEEIQTLSEMNEQVLSDCRSVNSIFSDRSFSSSDTIQPQGNDAEEVSKKNFSVYQTSPSTLNIEFFFEKSRSSKMNETKDRRSYCLQPSNTILSLDEYFDPHFYIKRSGQASSSSSINSDSENVISNENSSLPIDNEDVGNATSKKLDDNSRKTRKKQEAKRPRLSCDYSSDILKSYFDPFFHMKPTSKGYVSENRSSTNTGVPKTTDEARAETKKIKPDKSKEPEVKPKESEIKCKKNEDTKSPYAILHEKSIKDFKLIPRCTIEKDGEIFKCKVVLDSHTGEGIGQSKKQAKIEAAVKLLNQL